MIQFPETADDAWRAAATVAEAPAKVKQRIERGTAVENAVERMRVNHEAKVIFQAELDSENTPMLEMMTLDDYRNTPTLAPSDVIEGVAKEDGLTVVVGPSGSGKTTVALQMVHSLTTGADWLGQPVTNLGAAGVLSYDMDASMVFDWLDGAPNIDPAKVSVINAYKRGNPLGVPQYRQKIAAAWRSMGVGVVLLDSFSASFHGTDQNDAAATMAHYRDLKLFALTEVGAKALIVIAHSTDSNPAKMRGSTVHKDTADTTVVVQKLDSGFRKVWVDKYRAARGQQMMNPVVIGAPDAVTHLVSLDIGQMNLAGMPLPAGFTAPEEMFPELPKTHEDPVADTDSEEQEDML